jgi:hypothetical protein
MKILKSLFSKNENKIQPQQHYSWIIHHVRATDRVFFGPFKDYRQVDNFFNDPKNKGIQCSVELLISPNCPKEQYWYNPTEYLLDNHFYLFDRDPQNVSI